jgi:hypothetical protein
MGHDLPIMRSVCYCQQENSTVLLDTQSDNYVRLNTRIGESGGNPRSKVMARTVSSRLLETLGKCDTSCTLVETVKSY